MSTLHSMRKAAGSYATAHDGLAFAEGHHPADTWGKMKFQERIIALSNPAIVGLAFWDKSLSCRFLSAPFVFSDEGKNWVGGNLSNCPLELHPVKIEAEKLLGNVVVPLAEIRFNKMSAICQPKSSCHVGQNINRDDFKDLKLPYAAFSYLTTIPIALSLVPHHGLLQGSCREEGPLRERLFNYELGGGDIPRAIRLPT